VDVPQQSVLPTQLLQVANPTSHTVSADAFGLAHLAAFEVAYAHRTLVNEKRSIAMSVFERRILILSVDVYLNNLRIQF